MIKVRILNSEYVCDLKQDTNDKKKSFDYTHVSDRQIAGGYKKERKNCVSRKAILHPAAPSFGHSFVQMDFESDQGDDPVKAHHKNCGFGATLDFSQVSS